jgi:hypothetical protein
VEAIKLKDIKTPEEIITGCFSTRAAGAYRAAQAYEKLKDKSKADTYKKMATELLKKDAADVDKALTIKDEGNDLYKVRKQQKFVD